MPTFEIPVSCDGVAHVLLIEADSKTDAHQMVQADRSAKRDVQYNSRGGSVTISWGTCKVTGVEKLVIKDGS